uniref:Uncharacterized protein n=1 Tax=Entomoneis paludosa TaxID=265537 RepID=A0A6U2XW73_9STRA|mmetsp:Transcript_14299/g.29650  ORF Transcript_14299/g.29650 Transcript_14299/m.29650 type:complete len:289 (+) Transcript_14299:206-1072(+)
MNCNVQTSMFPQKNLIVPLFFLRPDGLGNRLEEIMNTNMIFNEEHHPIFVWRSHSNGRGDLYDQISHWLTVDGAYIVEENDTDAVQQNHIACIPNLKKNHSIMASNCKRIKPNFNISFISKTSANTNMIGVHIRKSDRITTFTRDPAAKDDQTTPQESAAAISLATNAIISKRPKPDGVFIASEDPKEAQKMRMKLQDAGVNILIVGTDPIDVHPVFRDFFALSMCNEIWMLSSFSSFAIMAARVGNDKPLYSLLPPSYTHLERYLVPDVRPFPIYLAKNSTPHAFTW